MVDGANRWQVFRHVTLPQLAPGHRLHRGLADHHRAAALRPRLHDDPGRPAGLHPDGRLLRLRLAFQTQRYGYGSAVAYGLFAVTMLLTVGMVIYARRSKAGGLLMAIDRIGTAPTSPQVTDAEDGAGLLAAVQPVAPAADAAGAALRAAAVQMVLTSFMTDADINRFPPRFIPHGLQPRGYADLFQQSHILRWLLNTVIVAVDRRRRSHLVLCSLAGYGFARLRVRRAHVRLLR